MAGTVVDADVVDVDGYTLTPKQQEVKARRLRVLQMRLRQMTESQIGAVLNVDPSTVSDDLGYIYKQWRDKYGLNPTIDPAIIVGEAIALYQESERLCLREANNLATATDPISVRTKLMAIKLANEMKDRQVALYQDLGIMQRALGTIDVTLPAAASIRRMLKEVHVSDDMLLAPAEQAHAS